MSSVIHTNKSGQDPEPSARKASHVCDQQADREAVQPDGPQVTAHCCQCPQLHPGYYTYAAGQEPPPGSTWWQHFFGDPGCSWALLRYSQGWPPHHLSDNRTTPNSPSSPDLINNMDNVPKNNVSDLYWKLFHLTSVTAIGMPMAPALASLFCLGWRKLWWQLVLFPFPGSCRGSSFTSFSYGQEQIINNISLLWARMKYEVETLPITTTSTPPSDTLLWLCPRSVSSALLAWQG